MKNRAVILRAASVRDVDTLFDIRCSVHENFQSREELATLGIDPGSVAAMLADPDHFAIIAERDGQPIGFAMAQYSEGYVFACFVRPEGEGRGVGKRLLKSVEAKLREAGVSRAWLSTDANPDFRARGFYRHLGWVDAGCLENGEIKLVKQL